MPQIAHKEREVEEMRRAVERSAVHHSDATAKPHLISQLRAKDDQIKVGTVQLRLTRMITLEAIRHIRGQFKSALPLVRPIFIRKHQAL